MAAHSDTAHHPDTPRSRGDAEAPHLSPATPAEDQRTILLNEIAWGAVLAGVVVALVTQLLLNMLGLGIGIATLDPGTGDNPTATSLSLGAGIWWTLSGILASLVGGYAAGGCVGAEGSDGRVARAHRLGLYHPGDLLPAQLDGRWGARRGLQHRERCTRRARPHGATTAGAAAPALSQMADPMASIENSLRGASGGNDPAALRDAAVTAMRAALTGDQAQAQEARERAAAAVARAQNIPIEEARTQVTGYEQQYRQAVDRPAQATEAADTAARAGLARGAVRLLRPGSRCLAGWFGGRAGAVYPTLTDLALPGRRTTPASPLS